MSGFGESWEGLSRVRRIALVVAGVVSVGLTMLFFALPQMRSMDLLFGGLDQRMTSAVVRELDRAGAHYEIRDTAVYVASGQRDSLRLSIAANGAAPGGPRGYEVLAAGLGAVGNGTAAYWQAKEGELARTLLAASDVEGARVQIGTDTGMGNRRPSSVTLTTTSGDKLSQATARIARSLVALATPNVDANAVTVLDSRHGIILRAQTGDYSSSSGMGDDRAIALKKSIEDLLAPLTGEGMVKVGVNIKTERESLSRSRRIVDAESRVVRSTETVELTEAGKSSAQEEDGDEENTDSSELTETRQNDQYDYTETLEENNRRAGSISRITVAVLINPLRIPNADGALVETPRTPAELQKFENLVKSAIGFNAERGDVVTIESLAFIDSGATNPAIAPPPVSGFLGNNTMEITRTTIAALAILLFGLFVARPLLTAAPAPPALEEEADDWMGDFGFAVADMDGIPEFDDDGVMIMDSLDLMGRLRETVASQMEESVEVLKIWLSEEPGQA